MIAHTLGNPFNLDAVISFCNENELWLIEDNCDALGSTYTSARTGTPVTTKTGSFGHLDFELLSSSSDDYWRRWRRLHESPCSVLRSLQSHLGIGVGTVTVRRAGPILAGRGSHMTSANCRMVTTTNIRTHTLDTT